MHEYRNYEYSNKSQIAEIISGLAKPMLKSIVAPNNGALHDSSQCFVWSMYAILNITF